MKNLFKLDKAENLKMSLMMAALVIIYFFQYLDPNVIINATDILTQQYFWEYFAHEQLHASPSFATWMPCINGGTPFGGGLEKLFRPLGFLFYYIFPPNVSIAFDMVLHFWLMGVGTYLYLRLIGLSPAPSFIGGLFFILSTEQVSLLNAGHMGKLNTIAWTPLVFWGVEKGIRSRRWIDFVVAGTLLSAQLFETHIQISFYVCIAIGIYFIARTALLYFKKEITGKETGKLYSQGVLMVVVFLCLSAFTLAHWLEFKGESERGEGTPYEFATSWSMPPQELATYVVPQLFGLSRSNYKDSGTIKIFYWGEMPFTQTADYLGLLPLVLAALALVKGRNRYVYIFAGIAILFQILAMGKYTPIYYFFYKYLGFKFFRVPKMNLFIVSFAVSVVSAYGMQWLADNWTEKNYRFFKKFLSGLLVVFAVIALTGIYAESNKTFLIQYFMKELRGMGRGFDPSLIAPRYEHAVEGIWIACGLLLLSIGILSLYLTKRIRKEVYLLLLAGVFIFDITILNIKFMDTVPMERNDYFSRDTAVRYFERDKGIYRVINAVEDRSPQTIGYLVPNKYIKFNMHSATGYEAVGIARYNDLLEKMSLDGNIIDLLNIKYVVMDKYGVGGTVGDWVGKYEIVADEDVKILENKKVMPRAFPVHQASVLRDKDQVLMWLANPMFDPRKGVLLEKNINATLSPLPKPETDSRVRITSYKNSEIQIDASMADNGFVVLSEKYYPGWKAYLNGKPAEIYQADYIFRAVYVPQGGHKLVFRYEPDSYKKGLYISLVSVLIVAAVIVRHRLVVRRTDK